MGFISDLLTNISAFRIKIGDKLNWLNANKADTTALNDFVKKDGSVPMTGTLDILSADYEVLNLNSSNANNYVNIFLGGYSVNLGFSQGIFKNTSNPLDSFYHITPYGSTEGSVFKIKANGDVGIGQPNPQAKLHVNGNIITDNATASNHAVALGQLANYALTNGSNTIGGVWNINKINAPNLATANKQIFSEGGASVYFGNPQLEVVNFETLYDLIHIRNGVFGNVWTQHNFDPANYALLSQVYTQAQALGLFVGKTGVETIQDTKTFTHSPIVPNGTLSGHTVNLGQLNTILNDYALVSAIPTNNNQLTNGAGYITAAALGGYVLQTSLNSQLANYVTLGSVQTITATKTYTVSPVVPNGTLAGHTVNLGQMQSYVTGLGYQTASQVTAIVNNAVSAIPAPGNGSVVIQGINALTGIATFSMNQSNNVVGSFDLTQQTKDEIQTGIDAGSKIESLFGGLSTYFKDTDVSSGGNFPTNEAFFNLFDPGSASVTVGVGDHDVDGARLVLQSHGANIVHYNGNFIYQNSAVGNVSLENGRKVEFVWSAAIGKYKEVLTT